MADLADEPTLNDKIGTLSGDTPLSGGGGNPLGEVTFDSAGPSYAQPTEGSDPMAKLHMPQLKQNTTTTVSVNGVPLNGGGHGVPDDGVLPTNGNGSGVVGFARKFIGVPYVWGGTSPNGFDCSGFVQYVYKHMGVSLPRLSADQARAGKRVSFADLQPGDLVAIDNSSRNNGADHIGIYIGHGMVINAPRPGRSVEIDPLSAFGGGWGVRLSVPSSGGTRPPRRRPRSINPAANKPHLT